MTMSNEEQRFELDLRAAMAPEPASAELRRRVMEQAMPRNRRPQPGGIAGWFAGFDFRNWRLAELGAAAAVASLAVGIFVGANGMLGADAGTTTVASDDSAIDLVALAYDNSNTVAGDFQ